MAAVTPATPGVFELDAEYTAAFTTSAPRGRQTAPSIYLDAVREALKTGTPKGVSIGQGDPDSQAREARKVENELRKAARQLADEAPVGSYVKITTRVRLTHPKLPPFVGFTAEHVPTPAA